MDAFTQERLQTLEQQVKQHHSWCRSLEAQTTGLTWLARRSVSFAINRDSTLGDELLEHLAADLSSMSAGPIMDGDARDKLIAAKKVMTELVNAVLNRRVSGRD